jgi:hypothetical protein
MPVRILQWESNSQASWGRLDCACKRVPMVEGDGPAPNPLKGSSTFRERDDGRYTPKNDRILRCREVTLWANRDILHRKNW